MLAAAARGEDPSAERQSARNAPKVTDLADRYLREHAEPHKKPSSIASDRQLLNAIILPKLGTTKIAALTRADVARFHHSLREKPHQANRALALISKMLNLAELWGLRPDGTNPCRHLKRYREMPRNRLLSFEEQAALGEALDAAKALPGAIAAIRLLALTGCRVGEVLGLKWEDVTESGLHLADAKAGPRRVPLGRAAAMLLRSLPRTGAYVVHGPNPSKPLSTWTLTHVWRLIRASAGLDDFRMHDFRHLFGTVASSAGTNAFLVRDLLGHRSLAITGRYVERDNAPLQEAADLVSETIAQGLGGKKAEVVPMKR